MSRFFGSIRTKIQLVLMLLLLLLGILSVTGVFTLRLYRDSVLFVSRRSQELPLFLEMSSQISQMRMQAGSLKDSIRERETLLNNTWKQRYGSGSISHNEQQGMFPGGKELFGQRMKDSFVFNLQELRKLERQCDRILRNGQTETPTERVDEWRILQDITAGIDFLEQRGSDSRLLDDPATLDVLGQQLEEMRFKANELIITLQEQITEYSLAMQSRYRRFLGGVCSVAVTSGCILLMFLRLMYAWIFRPLRELVDGSQMVAQGRFNYRIKLDAKDEMSQLAEAFNKMTERFETIRNDLDDQVQTKSRELVRTERLASVGFLAAGVAHEINNPLASIAMSAESLQRRIIPLLESSQNSHDVKGETPQKPGDCDIIARYLTMIQEEAFRCKGITEKLLDFARTERKIREHANLAVLVTDIVDMLGPMGKYRGKHIRLDIPAAVYALVNPQEMKQVVLNLLTNALDSVDDGGTVWIRLFESEGNVHLVFEDDGCGMSSEILQNVFEPFFTKRQNGQQGTGLGLSITHRIITEHQGRIEACSAGPGRGAVFQVEIPVTSPDAERLAAMKSKEIMALRRAA